MLFSVLVLVLVLVLDGWLDGWVCGCVDGENEIGCVVVCNDDTLALDE